ncbi:MAG: asparagine synthetase B [Spirochaetota bacterium]
MKFIKYSIIFIPIIFIFINFVRIDLNALQDGRILIPMDSSQSNHLKAYGIVYRSLMKDIDSKWLLNFRGGSFLLPNTEIIIRDCLLYNVSYEIISKNEITNIFQIIENNNMEAIEIKYPPKIAVYTPPDKEPWDDAVTLVLNFAEIPYDTVWDKEVLNGKLSKYDWLHLHHEDFTGQLGKYHAFYKNASWYIKMYKDSLIKAKEAGYSTIQEHKTAVAKNIQNYVQSGGFLFAMCAATDTIDIALASDGYNIVPEEISGLPIEENLQSKLDYTKTFAFKDFKIITDPNIYEFSTIDINIEKEGLRYNPDTFQLFEFSAKIDSIPSMLTQNHELVIKNFLGQTTGFYEEYIKNRVTILAKTPNTNRIKYIYSTYGEGFFCFYGGHDPEDYRHFVGDPPTDLSLYPNSSGYRLILNNILFPASKMKPRKTL